MASEMSHLSFVMKSSKGRDKVCAIIQYAVQLYVNCMKHSLVYGDLVKYHLCLIQFR